MKELLQTMNELLSELDKAENKQTYQRLFPLIYKIQQLQIHNVVRSLPDFKFTEWLGETYIRLNQVWVHRYSSQIHKENWKTTEELYELYLKQQGQ